MCGRDRSQPWGWGGTVALPLKRRGAPAVSPPGGRPALEQETRILKTDLK